MAVLLIHPYQEFFDDNGNPLSGGKVYTYQAGTTTPKATFTDNTETVQAPNPVILDSAGRATMWGAGTYKFAVYDANDVLIRTTDNVATYTTADALGNSYFEAFSGNGTQTAFTLSQNLGTDENAIMVFVADGLEQHVTNGDFATDTVWTKGTGWTIGSGVATATGAISTTLSQTSAVPLLSGQSYNLRYTVTRSAGGIIPRIGSVAGVERTANGTYTETIIAGSTQLLEFVGNAFTGTLDNISITPADAKGYDIQSPASYTINGTTLTFGSAPPAGTGNIYVFAPSLLVAAANAAAAAADASATAANNSAIAADASADAAAISEANAAASAANLSGTSTTSVAIGTGTKSFTTQAGKFFGVGSWMLITSGANPANYMHGQVTAYSGTSLDVNVTNTGGSGTFADWTIRVSGTRGTQGAAGTGLTNATPTVAAFADFAEATNNGTNTVTVQAPAALAANATVTLPSDNGSLALAHGLNPGGRLTLTTGVPVTTTDVTSSSAIFYTPYTGNQIALYNGTAWQLYTFTERSLALSGLVSGRPYDVFLYDNAGTLTLELTAWTNDTTRATGLVYQDGILVRSGASSRRYLGTIYTTATNATADSEANRFVWNYYNRVNRSLRAATEGADTWTYTTATFRQANANTANQLNFVIGVAEDSVSASVIASAANTTAGVNIGAAIGLNSTTTPATGCINPLQRTQVASGTTYLQTHAQWTGIPAAGRNFLAWLEWSTATGTTTWLGDGGGTTFFAGIHGMMRA